MKLVEKIKTLYKRLFKLKTENNQSLLNIIDLLPIRKREELTEEEIKELERYKEEYLKKLSKKILHSVEFDTTKTKDKIKMQIDLVLNLLMRKNNIFVNDSESILDKIIKPIKIKLYQSELETLKEEAELKLIALKEIEKEKTFFSTIKKNALKNEMNNLSVNFLICVNGKESITFELNSWDFTMDDNIEQNDILMNHLDEIMNMLKIVLPEKYRQISSMILAPKEMIVLIEMLLEEYVYTHKNDIEYLDKELERLEKENKPFSEIKNQFDNLLIRYKIFHIFGRNIVTEEQLKQIFKVELHSIAKSNIKSSEIDKTRLQFYEEIILDKMSKINTSVALKTYENKNDITKLIRDYLTYYCDSPYDIILDIIYDKRKLLLLLFLETEDGLNKYFNYKVNKNNYDNLFNTLYYQSVLNWEENLPISTICQIEIINKIDSPLIDLYNFLYETNTYRHQLPYGLIGIKDKKTINKHYGYRGNLFENSQNKILLMPSTLKYIYTEPEIQKQLFSECKLNGIIFNDELEYLALDMLVEAKLTGDIILSGKIKKIVHSHKPLSVNFLKIRDFEEMLENRDNLKELLRSFIRFQDTTNIYIHGFNDDLLSTKYDEVKIATLRLALTLENLQTNKNDKKSHKSRIKLYSVFPTFQVLLLKYPNISVSISSDELSGLYIIRKENESTELTDDELENYISRIYNIIIKRLKENKGKMIEDKELLKLTKKYNTTK